MEEHRVFLLKYYGVHISHSKRLEAFRDIEVSKHKQKVYYQPFQTRLTP